MRGVLPLTCLMLLAACADGGSGSPTPSPTPTAPANTAPNFTSAATASMVENNVLAYQATATDAQNDPITFTIDGGADAARFTITPSGALNFLWGPGFESPLDADQDNIYRVRLRASDGQLSNTMDVAITVTDAPIEHVHVRWMNGGYDQPTSLNTIPGTSEAIWVIEKTGGIWHQSAVGGGSKSWTIDNISTGGQGGLLSFVANQQHFAFVTAPDGTIEIRRYALGQPISYQVALSIPAPRGGNYGGWMGFGPDGYLYIATGDGGGVGDPDNNAQNPNSLLGKILRIQVDPDPNSATPFHPAPGNPFIGGGGNPLIYAMGFRDPTGGSFDGNRLIIGDRGDQVEEINLLPLDQPGLNFGWPFLQGTLPYRGMAPSGLTAPVTQYNHGTGPNQGSSFVGGFVYRQAILGMQDRYVFGDRVSGNIWTVPISQLVQGKIFPASDYDRRNIEFQPDAHAIERIAAFGLDTNGYPFMIDSDGDFFVMNIN